MSQYTTILFDLDGTVIDSASGITSSLAKTLAELGKPAESHEVLMKHVGPPLETGFIEVSGMTPAEADEATKIYRKYYNTQRGYLDSNLFPGITDVLATLSVPMAVATSKEEHLALTVTAGFNLQQYFSVIRGSSLDESRRTKSLVVKAALSSMRAKGADLSRPVLIGDRHHDVNGAHSAGIECIGVKWGYSEPGELAEADAIAANPQDLLTMLTTDAVAAK